MRMISIFSAILIFAINLFGQELIYPEDANFSNQFGIRAMGPGSNIVAIGNGKVYLAKSLGQASFEIYKHDNSTQPYAFAIWDGTGWSLEAPGYVNVKDMVVYGSNVIICGTFTQIEGQPFNYIAGWDGTKWFSVGGGVDGPVNTLATDGTSLFAGGSFSHAGDTLASNVAWFDGVEWRGMYDQGEITQGTSGEVLDIAFGSGVVVVGTFGTAGGVNASNVASWSKLGPKWTNYSTGTNARIRAVTPTNEGLVIGGDFSKAGGNDVNNIAIWDGTDWQPMANGSAGVVSALTNSMGEAVAYGRFNDSFNFQIARYRNSQWEVLGGDNAMIDAISMVSDGTNVWVGNQGSKTPGLTTGNLAYWSNEQWHAVGNGIGEWWSSNDAVRAITEWENELIVSGRFGNVGGDSITGVARWDGTNWDDLGDPFDGLPFVWVDAMKNAGNNLYVAGWFNDIAGTGSVNIGRWNGAAWSGLGTGVNGKIAAVEVLGSDVYVGGNTWKTFDDGSTQYYFAHWDGTDWQPFANPPGGIVNAMMADGTDLYVGGQFSNLDDFTAMNAIGIWDGTDWKEVGGGVTGGSFYTLINAIAKGNNGIYVGGDFTMAGEVAAKNIARWDGTQWHALGEGIDGEVFSVYANGNDVYAGGHFTTAAGDTVWGMARWDGSQWNRIGNGVHLALNYVATPTVFSFLGTESALWIGGNFSHAGVNYSHSIAKYEDFTLVTALGENSTVQSPEKFELGQNYPNPFNPGTTISYNLPQASKVSLKIFNTAGQLIRTLQNSFQAAGQKTVAWNGTNNLGQQVPSGVYVYKIEAGDFSKTRKAILLK